MTPYRISGGGVKSVGRTKFSTPFKPGMGPGEFGRAQLEARMKAEAAIQTPVRVGLRGTPSASAKGKAVARREYTFFDLSKPLPGLCGHRADDTCGLDPRPDRKSLASSGLRPQSYAQDELEHMGM